MPANDLHEALVHAFAWISDRGDPRAGADRTRWLRDPRILGEIGAALAALVDETPSVVIGPQTSGYGLGALVAAATGAGFAGVEKGERRYTDSDPWIMATTPLDYRGRNAELGLRKNLLGGSDRVLVVDDWADTGGQLLALQKIVELSGARLVGTVVIVDGLSSNSVRRQLGLRSLLHLRDLRD